LYSVFNSIKLNKKSEISTSLTFFIELVLVALLIMAVFSAVKSKISKQDYEKASYSILYSYYTTLLGASPDDIAVVSDEKRPFITKHDFSESFNYVGIISKEESGKYYVYPYIKTNYPKDFKNSYVDDFIYFVRYGNNIKIANFN